MKDLCGDEVYVEAETTRVRMTTIYSGDLRSFEFSASGARSLAKKLKRAARELEARA